MPGTTDILAPPAATASRLKMFERLPALVFTVMALYLHWVNFNNAGGFWRDEANSVTMSLLPGLGNFWSALQHDSFPALHYLVIRMWGGVIGADDASLRCLGLVVGVLLIVALWFKAAWLERRAPVVSLLLIGLNPLLIRHLDALRPNGMAALAAILVFTAVWRSILRTDVIRLATAAIVILLSTQLLFQDAIFILAIGIAAMITGFRLGGIKRAALLAIPFLLAPFSLLPYVKHLRDAANWVPVAMPLLEDKALLPGLLKVLTAPQPWLKWVWLLLGVTAVVGMLLPASRDGHSCASVEQRSLLRMYCGITLVISAALFMLFLAKGVGISPQPWHYAPMLVLLVASAESLVGGLLDESRWQLMIHCIAFVCGIATILPASRQLQARMTSMDIVANAIAGSAGPDDMVVLVPWHNGVSFSRYYNGRAPWISFPALKENRLHRYDLLKERMMHPGGVADDLETVLATLQRGGKVWVVGSAFAMEPGTRIEPLPPAPLQSSGWSSTPYLSNWNKQLMAALATHALDSEQLSLNSSRTFSQESPLIRVFSGYRNRM